MTLVVQFEDIYQILNMEYTGNWKFVFLCQNNEAISESFVFYGFFKLLGVFVNMRNIRESDY